MNDQPIMHQKKKKDTPQYLLYDALQNHADEYTDEEIALIKEYLDAHQNDDFQRARELITSPPLSAILEHRQCEYRLAMQQRGKEMMAEWRRKDQEAIIARMEKTQEERKRNIERARQQERKRNIDRVLQPEANTLAAIKTSTTILTKQIPIDQKVSVNIKKEPTQKKGSSVPLKERLSNSLGAFGFLLYYIIRIIVVALPFIMIGGNFFITLLLVSINTFVPFASIVFWIWGLVSAINGVQDFWAIIYYIAFSVIWLPFFISSVKAVFSGSKE